MWLLSSSLSMLGWAVFASCALAQQNLASMRNKDLIQHAPSAESGLVWDENKKTYQVPPEGAEIRRRIEAHQLTDADWQELLIKSGMVYSHPRWPRDQAYAVGLAFPIWLTDMQGEISAKARLSGSRRVSTTQTWGGCALGNDAIREQRRYLEVGKLDLDATSVVLDVEFRSRMGSRTPTWTGSVTLPVQIVPSAEQATERVRDPNLDAFLKDSVSVTVGDNQGSPPSTHLWVSVEPSRSAVLLPPDIAFHFTATLMDGEREVERLGPLSFTQPARNGICFSRMSEAIASGKLQDSAWVSGLTLRITPDRSAAFRDLHCEKSWDGELTIPVKDVLNRPAKPASALSTDRKKS